MRTICVYDSKMVAGVMSAAIVKYWFIKTNDNPVVTNEYSDQSYQGENRLHLLEYNYGDDIPDFTKYDKLILLGVNFPIDTIIELQEMFKQGKLEFTWIDNRLSVYKDIEGAFIRADYLLPLGLREESSSICELVWDYFLTNTETIPLVNSITEHNYVTIKKETNQIIDLFFNNISKKLSTDN